MEKLYAFFKSRSTASLTKAFLAVFLLMNSKPAQAWQGNGTMACNDLVQVSLDYDCQAEITPDMILEGSNNGPSNLYTVRISNITGTIVNRPGFHSVTVTNIQTNNNCWGSISVEDKLPPLVDNCPCAQGSTDPECQFYCIDLDGILNGTISVPQPLVNENCGTYTTVKSDQVIDGSCGQKIIKRSYVFTDESGNKSSPCVSYFNLQAVNLAAVTPPNVSVQLNCGSSTTPESIFDFFKNTLPLADAHKNAYPTINGRPIKPGPGLCNVLATYTDVETLVCGTQCSNSKKVLRSWLVLDWCTGQSATYIQQIKATDNQAPTIVAADITVTTDPWGCFSNVEFPAPTTLHDNCTSSVTYDIYGGPIGTQIIYDATDKTYTALNVPKGVHTFYYRATDCCNNVGTDGVTVTVIDRTAPVAISKQNVVVSLTTSGPGQGVAKVYANSIDNGSHDGCTPVHLELRRDEDACNILGNTTYNNDGHSFDSNTDPDNGAFIKFCCADLTGVENGVPYGIVKVWLRVWDDGDMNGIYGSAGDNFNETWSYVRVEDKLPPTIKCPSDITIQCDQDYTNLSITGSAVGGRTCAGGEVEYTDTPALSPCGVGTVNRRWYVKGNPSVFCIQRITIRAGQPFNPATIRYPSDVTTDCRNLNNNYKPTWTDVPCSLVGYAVESDTFKFEDGACLKIINTFTVVDWCIYQPNATNPQGIWTGKQIIKVEDNTAPVISCTDLMLEAADNTDADGDNQKCELIKGWKLSNTASDNGDCASQWLKWIITIDLWGDGIADYEYNSFLPVNDNTFNDSNNNGVKDKYIAPTASGQMVMVEMPEDIIGSMSNHKINWRVSDGCGNVSACSQNLMVVDKKKPTPYCVSISTALMKDGKIELWARDFDLNSFDNCTDQDELLFTLDESHPVLSKLNIEHYFKGKGENATLAEFNAGTAQRWLPSAKSSSQIFDCDDLPSTEVKMTVWDLKNNFDYCVVTLNLVDNQGACDGSTRMAINGKIQNESGSPMKEVAVGLKNMTLNTSSEKTTNDLGGFDFTAPQHLEYELKPTKTDDILNGVSTLDLVLIQRHILNTNKLGSAYKVISADINNDERISAADLVELRKLILGTNTTFTSNNSWRFVSTKNQFGDISKPWPFTEKIQIANLSSNMTEDFVACKIGDVNNSAILSLKTNHNAENRTKETSYIQVEEAVLEAGKTYKVALSSLSKLEGYQFGLSFKGIVVSSVYGENINSSNYSLANDKLIISWNDVNGVQGDLFYLEFVATSPGLLSEKLSLNSELISSEAYSSDLDIRTLELGFNNNAKYEYALLQNQPNPFAGKTTIGFTLPEAGEATLSIYDIAGRQLYSNTSQFVKGLNLVEISTASMNASGVMYYKLESGSFTATQKMIDLK